ncbi:MAG: methyltransferase [Blastocatellia bacterium]|nr:methyltransferase [Blastocatellia bacterium]
MTETTQSSPNQFRKRLQRLRVPLGFFTAILFVVGSRPTWRSLMIGLPIALGGVLIRAWASGHLHKNAELAVSGPYAHTRNPLYFGSFVMAIGCAVAGGHLWLGLLLVGFFLLVYVPVMQAEVAHMQSLFADAYSRWAASVPLFLPRLTPYASGSTRGFDPQQYLHHREYRALFGLTIVMVFLFIKAARIL